MKIVVFGATSDIAAACLELWAARGDSLHLCSRDLEQQALLATRLRERWGVEVLEDSFDAGDATALTAIVERIEAGGGEIDLVLLAFGLLGKNREALHDPVLAGQIIQVNFTATVHLLTALLPLLERQHRSRIAVISSVAGERGRSGLAVYSAAKAGVTTFMDGLRGWLHSRGISVTVIKPGIIRTGMTAHLPASPLISRPDKIAPAIVRAIDKRRHQVYVPGFWRVIMTVVRLLPETLFKRINR